LLPVAAWAQMVGQGSCVGEDACTGNTGLVGNAACIGGSACAGNTGAVGNAACIGAAACWSNSGTIGPGQCIGDWSCYGNMQNIPWSVLPPPPLGGPGARPRRAAAETPATRALWVDRRRKSRARAGVGGRWASGAVRAVSGRCGPPPARGTPSRNNEAA